MNNTRYNQCREQWSRFRRACRHLFSRTLKWAILSYGFVGVYGALYGSGPAVVHHLDTTLVALSAGFAGLFISLVVLTKLVAGVTGWLHRRRRLDYG
jgi:hypothetical protein